jgi:hypothetical protein
MASHPPIHLGGEVYRGARGGAVGDSPPDGELPRRQFAARRPDSLAIAKPWSAAPNRPGPASVLARNCGWGAHTLSDGESVGETIIISPFPVKDDDGAEWRPTSSFPHADFPRCGCRFPHVAEIHAS